MVHGLNMDKDPTVILLEIIEAQKVFVTVFAQALEAEGVTSIDALTRHMEAVGGAKGRPLNHLVEQMVDALRAEL